MHAIEIRHNFEAGHRLPTLPGKCQSLHGHSFWATVTITGPTLNAQGILAEYAEAKSYLRGWIDQQWDHGLILATDDPLLPILKAHGKVHDLGPPPTVENLAMRLAGVMETWCHNEPARHQLHVTRVHIQETHVNAATWTTT